jgi:hypothetical protein
VKHDKISLVRRHLMIAGVAAPAGVLAAPFTSPSMAAVNQPFMISGRLVDANGKPVAHAVVEAAEASATTDGDGRFMLETTAGITDGCPQPMNLRVRAATQQLSKRLDFEPARVLRDEAGMWRAGVSLNFA